MTERSPVQTVKAFFEAAGDGRIRAYQIFEDSLGLAGIHLGRRPVLASA
ncbi:hypothetical protein J4573_17625 [Actinomadura barringtoniae]|uniref:Uncharacterized protein n=1 Tax=Actinomadura barringtoniae TaxID=1427535 RepID=A0A939T741_9ACTN|nr:hypothetical protein [Actinomadura barringtoniae]MBO2448927.1 hypothetical protein [Actinomadura barringtoniae]